MIDTDGIVLELTLKYKLLTLWITFWKIMNATFGQYYYHTEFLCRYYF